MAPRARVPGACFRVHGPAHRDCRDDASIATLSSRPMSVKRDDASAPTRRCPEAGQKLCKGLSALDHWTAAFARGQTPIVGVEGQPALSTLTALAAASEGCWF